MKFFLLIIYMMVEPNPLIMGCEEGQMTIDLNEGNRRLQEEALASPPASVEQMDPATIERDAEFMV